MATHAIIPGTERFTSGPRNDSTNARAVPLWLNPDEIRPTQYLVYLHTISRRSFEQPSGISVPGEMYRMPDDVWARVEAGEPPHL